ncbi:ras-related protein Rab-10 [Histomonas meleagridis]|uniref:ras-related protein Rab-10 n=1 Tax=Histomonas meleagridis TaxID=135588 RepID=UPI00355A27CC|nr:ras-related protein Rab-10 [Histomonas meleagridis]KAH0802624.1 ras-related protein Rab-10 [Histomonas meleagridis]
MEENQDYQESYKIILLGDSNVGKTSIINRYCKDLFEEECQPTVGIGFQPKIIEVDGVRIKLAIWDTAGQEKYRTLTKQFYRNVDGVIVVYDITDIKTLENIKEYWIPQLELHSNSAYQTMIVGNKIDLRDKADPSKIIPREKGEELAKSLSTMFIETSAKNSDQIQNAFTELLIRIRGTKPRATERPSSVDLNVNEQQNNSFCC